MERYPERSLLCTLETVLRLLIQKMDGKQPQEIDFYTLEESWAKASNYYSADPEGDCIATAKRIFKEVFQN